MKKIILLNLVCLIIVAHSARGEEHFGITVYPNVKQDADTDWYCGKIPAETEKMAMRTMKVSIKSQAACYRTGDDFKKVADFYQKHAGIKILGNVEDKGAIKNALFCKNGTQCAALGAGVDVSVTTPWAAKTQQKDVLVLIRKSVKK